MKLFKIRMPIHVIVKFTLCANDKFASIMDVVGGILISNLLAPFCIIYLVQKMPPNCAAATIFFLYSNQSYQIISPRSS